MNDTTRLFRHPRITLHYGYWRMSRTITVMWPCSMGAIPTSSDKLWMKETSRLILSGRCHRGGAVGRSYSTNDLAVGLSIALITGPTQSLVPRYLLRIRPHLFTLKEAGCRKSIKRTVEESDLMSGLHDYYHVSKVHTTQDLLVTFEGSCLKEDSHAI